MSRLREQVLVARRVRAVAAAFDQAGLLERAQPRGQACPGSTCVDLDVVEAGDPKPQLAQGAAPTGRPLADRTDAVNIDPGLGHLLPFTRTHRRCPRGASKARGLWPLSL